MNVRFLIFLLIVFAIVVALIIYEQNRENPWNSDVFFSQRHGADTFISDDSIKPKILTQDTISHVWPSRHIV